MQQAQYAVPHTLSEAAALLGEGAGMDPAILAGGTDLLVQLGAGLRAPRLIVDVKQIPELISIAVDAGEVRIGAAVSSAEINEHPQLGKLYPGVVEALDLIGSTQIQGRATPGGNLCNASPAADSVPAMVAAGARCQIYGAGGERQVAAEDFVVGPGKTVLAKDEFLAALILPVPAPRTADAYLRFIPRTEMDIAAAGAGVCLTLDEGGECVAARVAIGAVAPTVLLVPKAAQALIGSTLDDETLKRAGDAATAAARPITDKRGTIEFRREIVGVLTRRAAAIAGRRARGEIV